MSNPISFRTGFELLTGNPPFPWQERMFAQFVAGEWREACNLPTGLGKTSLITIWLLALSDAASRGVSPLAIPRRLVYVVDRRTVVDQATKEAEGLRRRLDPREGEIDPGIVPVRDVLRSLAGGVDDLPLAISTLRGQFADNSEWRENPARPAIIVGTVDMIGSRLLFSGYRSSFKRRPMDAGLLGQDSLLLLDEAHLSKPFDELLSSITAFQESQEGQDMRMRVIRMSATNDKRDPQKVFFLDTDPESPNWDLRPNPDPTTGEEQNLVLMRYTAAKTLFIGSAAEKKKLNQALSNAALALAEDKSVNGKRIVVFVRSPADATGIADLIRKHEVKDAIADDADGKNLKAARSTPFATSVEVLTGTMRGMERDELLTKDVLRRFLNGKVRPTDPDNQHPVFLVSTSAGEVGFDLNADHMICDEAPLDSMIQRLGRVNRRGLGRRVDHSDAAIRLIPEKREKIPEGKSDIDKACVAAVAILRESIRDGDVSPKALDALRLSLPPDDVKSASSPEPATVELTDILLDAWSMTSITERMPGRPEVAPWLRGIADEVPQTTIAWRAELDLFKDDPTPKRTFQKIFDKHRIRAHETLTTNSYRVVDFLKEATKAQPALRKTHVIVKFSRDLEITTVENLIDKPGPLNADPTLILPASFGGLDKGGFLSSDAVGPITIDANAPSSLDVADAPGYEPRETDPARFRVLMERTGETWKANPFPAGQSLPEYVNPEEEYNSSKDVLKALTGNRMRIRLVQPVVLSDQEQEEGTPQSMVFLAPAIRKSKQEKQSLASHVCAVKREAERIAGALQLAGPLRSAVKFAATWHDEGKRARIWQRFIGRTDDDDEDIGKAPMTRDSKLLRGYRHEFGSLRRILHPTSGEVKVEPPPELETRDLALHLIATHHGSGRPHFDNPIDRDATTAHCEAVQAELVFRFARLQRKYGWWRLAWLENLLRCPDALASADQESEDDASGSADDTGDVE